MREYVINKMIRILFVSNSFSTFVKKDIALLKEHHTLIFLHYKGLKTLVYFLPRLIKSIRQADLTISRFADNHAFYTIMLSKIFHKKSIIIIGGYELASLPGLKYGLNRSVFFPRIVKYILRKSDQILVVSESLKKDAIERFNIKASKILVVPNGYDSKTIHPSGQKENKVLTAAIGSHERTIKLKGLDVFSESAKYLPEVKFEIIGLKSSIHEEFEKHIPSNVRLLNSLPQDKLIHVMQKAKVYCQLSMREGHPNTLCEAMLCECVPVGTDVPGIRAVIGDMGFLVPLKDPQATAVAIKNALQSNGGRAARERISRLYPLLKRQKSLDEIIQTLWEKS